MGSKCPFPRVLLTLVGVLGILFGQAEAGMVGEAAPEITDTVWINSSPLQIAGQRGRVILLKFWTYG